MKGCFLDNRYACGPAQNFDHLNNPYDRLVNPNYLMPYCKPYYSPLEPNDQYGPPINTISLGIKKL